MPVKQKEQLSEQPTWEEMQSVPIVEGTFDSGDRFDGILFKSCISCFMSGIKTVSISEFEDLLSSLNSHFRVPSIDNRSV